MVGCIDTEKTEKLTVSKCSGLWDVFMYVGHHRVNMVTDRLGHETPEVPACNLSNTYFTMKGFIYNYRTYKIMGLCFILGDSALSWTSQCCV